MFVNRIQDLDENYPLHFAVRASDDSTDILELILQNGGDVTVNDVNSMGQSSLHVAAKVPTTKSKEVISLLLDNGADKELVTADSNELTAEEIAETEGDYATAEFIR